MKLEEFEKLVEEGVAMVPARFLAALDNLAIVIEERPSAAQLKRMQVRKGFTLFGLYEGVPLTARTAGYSGALPDKITIFRKIIEAYAATDEEVRQLVRDTVWHELAHHFGSDERGAAAAARSLGKKAKK